MSVVCSCSNAEAEPEIEIYFTSASFSLFACHFTDFELLLAAQTATLKDCPVLWVAGINDFCSVFRS